MGGCCVLLVFLILIPAFIAVVFLLAGTVIASIAGILFSAILLIIGNASGLFKKFCNSPVKWQRIVAKIIKIILILVLIFSIAGLALGGYFINLFFN